MRPSNHSIFHIIISSAGGKNFLTRVNQEQLFSYLHGMLFRMRCKALAINGYGNHVHIVVNVSPDMTINQLIRDIQQNSIDFLRCERSVFPAFTGWDSEPYFASCSPSQKDEILSHLKNQAVYHQSKSLEDELEELAIYIE